MKICNRPFLVTGGRAGSPRKSFFLFHKTRLQPLLSVAQLQAYIQMWVKKHKYLTVTKAASIYFAVRIHFTNYLYINTYTISLQQPHIICTPFSEVGGGGGFIFPTTGHGHSHACCVTIPPQFRYPLPSQLEPTN